MQFNIFIAIIFQLFMFSILYNWDQYEINNFTINVTQESLTNNRHSLIHMWQIYQPNQTVNIWHFSEDISASQTLINLSILWLKPCCKAASFEYRKCRITVNLLPKERWYPYLRIGRRSSFLNKTNVSVNPNKQK